MAKNILIGFTPAQFIAMINCVDNISALQGTGDEDFTTNTQRDVKLVDRALKKAGYKREYI